MSQFTVYKEEPLDGRWAEEANNLFDIDWLLEITNGQEEYAQRREHADKWLGLARNLGLEEEKNRGKVDLDMEGESVAEKSSTLCLRYSSRPTMSLLTGSGVGL